MVHAHSEATLYLHSPCFDGLVSGAIAWDYLETAKGWAVDNFQPVNYDRLKTWADTPLAARSAVVDFLYHPDAAFWADHHTTTFVNDAMRVDYERNAAGRTLLYDPTSPSCGMLLFRTLKDELSDASRYEEMAEWADRIDGARYRSVNEAVSGSDPAITINLSLTGVRDPGYGEMLLRALRSKTLDEIASIPDVRSRADEVRSRTEAGLQLVKEAITLEPGEIAVFRVAPGERAIVNRYSPYCFFPEASYSVALIRSEKDAKITAMRNPWREFESVQLGAIFKKYGGGGHQRVASVVIPAGADMSADDVLSDILRDVRAHDAPRTAETRAPA